MPNADSSGSSKSKLLYECSKLKERLQPEHKTCFKCGVDKPIDQFYAHPMMKDGRLGKCKDCTKSDERSNYYSDVGKHQEYERRREATTERRDSKRQNSKKRRSRHPEKPSAHLKVRRAVKKGTLVPMPCEVCGCLKVQAHHDDYSKPLSVRWLCFHHHRIEHGQITYAQSSGVVARSPTCFIVEPRESNRSA